jgi:hypothetical protein
LAQNFNLVCLALNTTGSGKQHHSDMGQQQQHQQQQATVLLVVMTSVTLKMRALGVLMTWTVKMGMKRSVKMTTWQGKTTGNMAVNMQRPWRYVPACRSAVVQGTQQSSLRTGTLGLNYARRELYALGTEQTCVRLSCCCVIMCAGGNKDAASTINTPAATTGLGAV